MLVVANDFINECLPIIKKQTGNSTYKNEDLFVYLRRAYLELQKEYPLFKERKEITTVSKGFEYQLDEEVIDIVSLCLNDTSYTKLRNDKFFELYSSEKCNNNTFCLDMNNIYLYPQTKENETIEIFYIHAKNISELESEISIPLLVSEALRFAFLNKYFEENPKRSKDEYVDLEIHYLKLFNAEIAKIKSKLKIRHKNVRTKYNKV